MRRGRYDTEVNEGTCLGRRIPAGRTLHITPMAVPVLSMLPMPVRVWSPMKQPTLAWPGRDRVALQGHENLAVVVTQVAVGRDRPQVDPFANIGVAQEPFVILVGMPVDDRGLDLAADPAVGPDRDAARMLAERVASRRRSNRGLRSV